MKLNNKGMAVASSLYAILILFVFILSSILILVSSSTNTLNKVKSDIIANLDGKRSTAIAAGEELIATAVTSGNGLRKDGEIYRYKGATDSTLDNYVLFNNELWRIVTITSDEQLKIVKDTSLSAPFDETGNRTSTNNLYCTATTGCNVWTKDKEGSISSYAESVTEDSSLYEYAQNSYFYNTLSVLTRVIVDDSTWDYSSIDNIGIDRVEAKVGLLNIEEYFKASNSYNSSTCNTVPSTNCINWLNTGGESYILNNSSDSVGECFYFDADGISSAACNEGITRFRPAVTLIKEIRIKGGTGSSSNPYILEYIP